MPPFARGPAINRGAMGGCCCGSTFIEDDYYYPYSGAPEFEDGPCNCCASNAKIIMITAAVDSNCIPEVNPFPCDSPLPNSTFRVLVSQLAGTAIQCFPNFVSECTFSEGIAFQSANYSGSVIASVRVQKCWGDGTPENTPCPDCFTNMRVDGLVICVSSWNVSTGERKRALSFQVDAVRAPGNTCFVGTPQGCGGRCSDIAGTFPGAAPCNGNCTLAIGCTPVGFPPPPGGYFAGAITSAVLLA